MTLQQRDALLEAAAMEEHRLWWAEETAATALALTFGDTSAAIRLLKSAIDELELR